MDENEKQDNAAEERTESGSYKFPAMDLTKDAKVSDVVGALKGPVQKELMKREGTRAKSKVQYIPHDYKDTSASAGQTTSSGEGFDSEGKKKTLKLED